MELFSVCISDFVLPLPIHPPNKDPEALHKPSAFPVFSDSLRSDPVSQILEMTAAFYLPILQCRQNCCNSVFRLSPWIARPALTKSPAKRAAMATLAIDDAATASL